MGHAHVRPLVALVLGVGLAACGGGATGPSGYGNNGGSNSGGNNGGTAAATITMHDSYFTPQFDTVTGGTAVTWQNSGQLQHTTTADDGSWDSGPVAPGASFTRTFSQTGTYPYHCTFHGSADQGMYGVLVVK